MSEGSKRRILWIAALRGFTVNRLRIVYDASMLAKGRVMTGHGHVRTPEGHRAPGRQLPHIFLPCQPQFGHEGYPVMAPLRRKMYAMKSRHRRTSRSETRADKKKLWGGSGEAGWQVV